MARSVASEPSFSTTRPVGRPKRGARPVSTATRSPSLASSVPPAGMANSLPSIFLSTGSSRPPPFGLTRKMPSTRCLGWSMILMTRPRWRMPPSSSVCSTFSSTRSPMPAASPGRVARGTCRRIFGAGPWASSSHSSGMAIRSPSRSRDTTSAKHGVGQGAGLVQLLAPLLDRSIGGEVAQHALELGPHGVLQAESAGNLTGADLAGLLRDEGEDFVLGGKGRLGLGRFFQNRESRAKSALSTANVVLGGRVRQPCPAERTDARLRGRASKQARRQAIPLPWCGPAWPWRPSSAWPPAFWRPRPPPCAARRGAPSAVRRLRPWGPTSAAALVAGLAAAFLPPLRLPVPTWAARASSRTMASSSVMVSGVLSAGSVALTPLWLA